jgi:tetratricopeptide (TPR) repeat protein
MADRMLRLPILALLAAATAALSSASARAAAAPAIQNVALARVDAGTPVQNVEMRTLAGGTAMLLSPKAKANVFIFFRTGQERSLDALKQMASCEKELSGKPIYWTAVVSSSEPAADVQALVAQSGIKMPVLIDEGDVLYDRLGVRLHPMVGITDSKFVVVAMEPYRQIEYCDVIKTRIKMLLGEATVADLDKVTNPPRSELPGRDNPAKKAQRDVNMARRLYEIGQYNDALKFADRALAIAPVAHAHTIKGQAYVKLGKCADAGKSFDEALKLDPKEKSVVEPARASCK